MAASSTTTEPGLFVQVLSYNTNLQGDLGTPQDLVDWLTPTLTKTKHIVSPDIIAVGFQELLPLHLGRKPLPRILSPSLARSLIFTSAQMKQ